MLCEHEKSALTQAAATGGLTAALRARLASCEGCRAAFAEEQALFAAVDSGLRAAANAEIPPSLLPRLRVAVESDTSAAPNSKSAWPWLVAAGAVAALAIFLARLPRTAVSPTASSPVTVASPPLSAQVPSPGTLAPAQTLPPRAVRHGSGKWRLPSLPVQAHANAATEPLVIVPPDERQAYLRFIAALQHHDEIARALAAHQPAAPANDVIAAAPLAIARLEIRLIDPQSGQQGGETDSANASGPGER